MSSNVASLRRMIDSAGDLQSIVRTMKALATSTSPIRQSVRALGDYCRRGTRVEVLFPRRQFGCPVRRETQAGGGRTVNASCSVPTGDGGLQRRGGRMKRSRPSPSPGRLRVWAVEERVHAPERRRTATGPSLHGAISVTDPSPLVGGSLWKHSRRTRGDASELHLFLTAPSPPRIIETSISGCCR